MYVHHANGQMHVNMIIRPAIEVINKGNVTVVYWFKSHTTSHGDFMFMLMCSWAVNRSFSSGDSSHKLPDMLHFMFEQIALHILGCNLPIATASLCKHYC